MTHTRRSTDSDSDAVGDHRTFEERVEVVIAAVLEPQLYAMGERFNEALLAHEAAQVAARDAAAATMDAVLERLAELARQLDALPARIQALEQGAHDERIAKAARAEGRAEGRAEVTGVRQSPLIVTTTAHPGGPADVATVYPAPISEGVGKVLSAVAGDIKIVLVIVAIAIGGPTAAVQLALGYLDRQPETRVDE